MNKEEKIALIIQVLSDGNELSVKYAEDIFNETIEYLKTMPLSSQDK